jgi:hypothetical protein
MPVTIARKTAKKRVNLKIRKKRGTKTAHSIIVRQPVAKSFASNIKESFPFSLSEGESSMNYNRSGLMKEGMAAIPK